ncbi:hypothetical protein DH2020_033957 [Rehmannia glutinosa]|uniref:F-box domain-containing protein n=1 Tax=Rehmannia glutinosa TaxID=99300 RepID=A0ABR0VCP9_REHGL
MEEDRISKLPDAIIQQIFSSLDPKQAVQTSVLSTKLWSTLPDLRFDYGHLLIQSGMDIPWTYNNTEFMSHFTRFVIHFLSRRDDSSTIGKFQLTSADLATDSTFVETCLYYAINHGVQHLDLDVYSSPTPFRFPDSVFVSKTLRELRVRQYTRSVVVPKPFVLPNLKTLYLDSFKFIEDNNGDPYSFPKEPFSKFDNLEKLTLHRCEVSGMIICSAKLRILEISFRAPLFSRETKMEQILAPKLTSFRYEGYVSLVCPKMDFPCLEEVYFDNFANLQTPYTDDIKKKMPLNLVRMLQQLGNAKFVTLSFHTREVLAMDPHLLEQSPSPFPYMKCLKLTKRRQIIHPTLMETVPQTVMNYLTKGHSAYGSQLRDSDLCCKNFSKTISQH